MSQWVFSGLKKGIVTTPYPRGDEKTPGLTPGRPRGGKSADPHGIAARCPTGAISAEKKSITIDHHRCVHCFACREDVTWEDTYEWAQSVSSAAGDDLDRAFRRSLHVFVVDAGDCGACLSEVRQLNSPYYNIHRLGFFITPTPRKADLMIVVGPVTEHMKLALHKAYEAMPAPKRVVAVGTCAASGGIFGPSFTAGSGAGDAVPVDVVVPGCPPPPLAIIHALLVATGRKEGVITR